MLSVKQQALLDDQALDFLSQELTFQFSERETVLLRCFFSNLNGRVCVMHSLPASIESVLCSMYSRMKNPRGLRGTFLNYVLSVLATELVEGEVDTPPEDFLKSRNIQTLDEFAEYSAQASGVLQTFLHDICRDPEYLMRFANSERAKKFMSRNRDKYGHNSIARMGSMTILFEGVSLLAAKAIELTRVGVGYVELSTRYVDMQAALRYPIAEHLTILGFRGEHTEEYHQQCFRWYKMLLGENLDGKFPAFLRYLYGPLFELEGRTDLELGIGGETFDVLGCLLPSSTLTSLCCHINGEALPQLLKHLLLEDTPETRGLVPLIIQELEKVGAGLFVRHYAMTIGEADNWQSLRLAPSFAELIGTVAQISSLDQTELVKEQLLAQFRFKLGYEDVTNLEELASQMFAQGRAEHDKLPSEFEAISLSVMGTMSFRGWRDLQRQQLATHNRTALTPDLGFYVYDKPAPPELQEAFDKAESLGKAIYNDLRQLPANLLEYVLPIGFQVGFTFGANWREHEFCVWQRTNPNVNHEVRKIFLGISKILIQTMPEWPLFSRVNLNEKFLFARFSPKAGPLKL